MKNKLVQIIRFLKESDKPITSSSIANNLNISPRSVKSYIQEINAILPNTISSSHKGYSINKENAETLLNSSKSTIPQTSDERISYIINRIIKSGIVDAYDLCDEIFTSYSTLKADLTKVRRILYDADLELINQNDTLMVNGLEKNKRKLLSNILYSESRNNFVNYEKMSSSFEGIDVLFIKQTILDIFAKHHFFINDYSLENLILHSSITIDRIRNGYSTDEELKSSPVIKSHEYELAKSIIEKFEKKFKIHFNEVEVMEFTMLILSRASNLDYETITVENVKEYIGEDTYQLAEEIISDFSAYFYIDLSQPEFFVRFALHIKNLLVRANSGYFSKNPLTNSIKQNCPLIYDSSVNAARLIKEKKNIYLSDDEIAYIAFHIGGALELQSTLTNKINVSILCPNYYNLNNRMSEVIDNKFKDNIVVSSIITQEDDLDKVNADMIISTLKTDKNITIPYIVVSPIINNQDLNLIENKIQDIRANKKRNEFKEHLSYLIKDELFTVTNETFDKNEAIHLMAERLKDLGYVGDSFEMEVLERDSISSTAFGSFAIPHAMKMHEKKTGINIWICKNPVDWDNQKVELVMMLCFNRNERYLFNELFEPISMILIDPDNMPKVLKANNAKEFIEILSSLLI